jgi:hypothetical protein
MAGTEDLLFHDVTFTIFTGPTISSDEEQRVRTTATGQLSISKMLTGSSQLIHLLTKDGATYISRNEDGSIDGVKRHTHIVTGDIEFPEYSRALDYNVHVVRPSWVETSYEKGRQTQPRQHSPDPSMFFREVIVSCADLPEGDKDAIIAGTLALGGLYSAPLTKLVTHVVAMDMHNDKCRTIQAKNLTCKIVLPHWYAWDHLHFVTKD